MLLSSVVSVASASSLFLVSSFLLHSLSSLPCPFALESSHEIGESKEGASAGASNGDPVRDRGDLALFHVVYCIKQYGHIYARHLFDTSCGSCTRTLRH